MIMVEKGSLVQLPVKVENKHINSYTDAQMLNLIKAIRAICFNA